MYQKNSATGTVKTTIEEICIELNEHVFIGDADVICHLEYEGYDPGDRETPPSGGYVTMYDTTVQKVYLYTMGGDTAGESTDEKHLKMVQDWIEKTGWMDTNTDWAAEQWSEDEQGKRDYAEECKYDTMREQQYFNARHAWKAGEGPHPY